jgi:hypothetical protein
VRDGAHEVRHLGNEMAHGDFVEPVDGEDAELVLQLMDERDRVGTGQLTILAAGRRRLCCSGGGGYEIRTREGVNPTRFPSL